MTRKDNMKTEKKKATPKTRVNMRIDAGLMKWVKKYAKSKGTCFTEIVVNHLVSLRTLRRGGT
jgi:predicted DNA binding CopG/RHH family protein